MRILFIADPLADFNVAKDSTYALMVEAARRQHTLFFCETSALFLRDGVVFAQVEPLTLVEETSFFNQGEQAKSNEISATTKNLIQPWYQLKPAQTCKLQDFDFVLMRKDPPFDIEYITATWLLSHAQTQGAKVLNDPRALRDHSEKIAIAEFSQFTAPTLVTRDIQRIKDFHAQYRDIIIKPLDGMGGSGVFRITDNGHNLAAVIEILGEQGRRNLMAQCFIPEISAGDKRVLIIAGQVVPFALARIPQGGEVRGNLAAGGRGVAQTLSVRDAEIAQTLAPILWRRGLFLVGLDIIGDYLTEVNVTSPTCLREINQQTGFNAAAMALDALESLC